MSLGVQYTMAIRRGVIAVLFATVLVASASASNVLSDEWSIVQAAEDSHLIPRLTFGVRQQNLDILEDTFWSVSDPKSATYGQHWTLEEVTQLVAPLDEHVRAVTEWLDSNQVVYTVSPGREFVFVEEVPVGTAKEVLGGSVDFHVFQHSRTGAMHVSAGVGALDSVSLPVEVEEAIDMIGGVVSEFIAVTPTFTTSDDFVTHANAQRRRDTYSHQALVEEHSVIDVISDSTGAPSSDVKIPNCLQSPPYEPACLRSFYQVDGVSAKGGGDKTSSQGFAEFMGQSFSPKDLSIFQKTFHLQEEPIAKVQGPNDGKITTEASLDAQWIMAIAQNVTTQMVAPTAATQTPFLDWIAVLAGDKETPWVHSVSYGTKENTYPTQTRLDTEFQKLGVRGVSLLFATGDGGVGCDQTGQTLRFMPNYPATSQYVTAVGGYWIPDFLDTVSATDAGKSPLQADPISTGGFSWSTAAPSYQSAVLDAFFKQTKLPASKQYNIKGRGVPDVSAYSEDMEIYMNGQLNFAGGTSIAAPTVAGFVSLWNDRRFAAGKSAMGFLNTFFYDAHASSADNFIDIIGGNNPSPPCQTGGFTAVSGWDPVTGLGSPDFNKLMTLALKWAP
eukprot:GFYU01004384.1.p1 GENE.GFYU01004384.1~~GFYU01004384.1.p1  ORF type:complete len:614 (+),score=216.98 GFYU01004384.1:64-1905(+)